MENSEIRELKKHVQKLATNQQLESLRHKLDQKAEKGQIRQTQEQVRILGERIEDGLLRTAKRDEFLGREVQLAKVGLSECVQRAAQKAEKAQVDSLQRQIRQLQQFDPQQMKRGIFDKIKGERGGPVASCLKPRIF